MADNPCDRVDAPKLGKYLPEVLSVEEVILQGYARDFHLKEL